MTGESTHEPDLTVLLVEDNEPDARYIEELFRTLDWAERDPGGEFGQPTLRHVDSLAACTDTLQTTAVDVVLLDLNLPDSRGLETVDAVLSTSDDVAVVVLTGLDDERVGVQAVERGAQDFLVKDEVTPTLLGRTIRYAIERQRRERRLRRRNEELALLNRLVRHDIRDDMALVRGWGQTLDDSVGTAQQEYLDRMLDASSHVIELTDTVGEFLDALQNREDLSLQAFALAPTLDAELEKARSVYPDATFDVDGTIPDVSVAATELLSSIFRNLLANAIEHNDSETPTVVVSATVDTETVTVAVSDNGPGVPDSRKDAIFGRTEAGLGDPECGVGLYLVDTLVDLYDGTVRVRDNDPRGSVFEVTLKRAAEN